MDDLALDTRAWEFKECKQLLGNPHVLAAFEHTEAQIKDMWTRADTVEGREACRALWDAFRLWKLKLKSTPLHLAKE